MKNKSFKKEYRKLIILLLALVFLNYFFEICYAAATCGVHMPVKNSIDFGIEHYSLRCYKTKDEIQAKLRGDGVFLTLSYGILDWLVVDFKFGSCSVRNDIFEGNKYSYDANWGGGYGFRWQIYKNKQGLKVITGIQHLSIHPKANNSDIKRSSIIDDSQAQLLVAKSWKNFELYTGIKSTIGRYIRKFNQTSHTVSLAEHISSVVGLEYYINNNWHLNLEARFLEEDSFSIGIRYQF